MEISFEKSNNLPDGSESADLPTEVQIEENGNEKTEGDISHVESMSDNNNKNNRQRRESFASPISLDFHKYTHSEHKPFNCVIYGENFNTIRTIENHATEAEHETESQRLISCVRRRHVSSATNRMRKHDKWRHDVRNCSFEQGKIIFTTISRFKFDRNVHLGFYSANDSKTTAGHDYRNESVRKIDGGFSDRKLRHSYENRFNGCSRFESFPCNACGSTFATLSKLGSHFRRLHSGEKPAKNFLCHRCGESFARASHLKRHYLRRHVPNAEKKHPCPVCGKTFLEKSDVAGHVKLRHENVKPFGCEECPKHFATPSSLRGHVNRIHLGLRPFECVTCSVRFKAKSHLEKHVRTHTGEKPFACSHCPYVCAEKSNLKKHVEKHLKSPRMMDDSSLICSPTKANPNDRAVLPQKRNKKNTRQ